MSLHKVTIDGKQVEVEKGTTIYKAAQRLKIDIPILCYLDLKDLNIENKPGGCRICSVEVEGRRNLAPSCSTEVSDGMVVRTDTERVKRARQDIVEFLLTSHPLDCPVCDKGGECPLQNQTMVFGTGTSRFDYDDKQHLAKHVALGDLIYLDRERCIQCGRCVRFQDEIADDPVLAFGNRAEGQA